MDQNTSLVEDFTEPRRHMALDFHSDAWSNLSKDWAAVNAGCESDNHDLYLG